MTPDNGRTLEWDDTLDPNAGDFVMLEPGEYDFNVVKYEKLRYAGGAKLPACWQAKVEIVVDGRATIQHNLFLHSKTEGLLCQFFKAIGARMSGDRLQMDWNRIAGATGRCVIEHRTWKGKDGDERTDQQIKKFIMPDEMTDRSASLPPPATPEQKREQETDIPF